MRYCTKTQEASRVTQVETIMPKAKLVEEAALETSSEIDNLLLEKTISYVKKLVGDTLKIPYKQIETYVGLEKYGIDSIAVEYLTYAFEKIFDGITSTTFFEYQSVNELAQYLVSTQRNKLLELFNMKTTKETSKKEQVVEATIQNKKQATHQLRKHGIKLIRVINKHKICQ
ncbi:acyl carrier protein [Cellulosilyticum ruminicola]|uniref:acyl carrier protein n=1 Tax=Cellulosilyticum ruminicola TaxID=425254 RepID=UPI0006D2BF21|nr:acyl carrier protein [Cellulosilyticum ruminicola]